MNPLVLAYIGDSVLELMTREYIIRELKIIKPNLLQETSIKFVSAKAQAKYISYALENSVFNDEELDFYRRGKNAKDKRTLKNTSPLTHRISSGFEAVLGHLHLTGQTDRIHEIFDHYTQFIMSDQ